jgi:mono/diheme cytochrome c family protein
MRSIPIRRAAGALAVAAWLVAAGSACSDSNRGWAVAKPKHEASPTTGSTAPPPAPSPILPTGGAGDPLPADHSTQEDIARASATDLAREPNTVDWSGGDRAHGQALYATQCALCHGGGGSGDGIAAPAINPKPRDFTDGRFYIDADANGRTGEDVDLARVILHGPAAFGGTPAMAAFASLSESDVRDLVAFIRTLDDSPAQPSDSPAPPSESPEPPSESTGPPGELQPAY